MTEYDIVMACENKLGWRAPRDKELWKARAAEVVKLKRAMKKAGVTVEDLRFAISYSVKMRESVASPSVLVYRVEQARERAVEKLYVDDLEVQIQDAIDFEIDAEMSGWESWVSRLTRAHGPARAEVFEEWSTKRLAEAA